VSTYATDCRMSERVSLNINDFDVSAVSTWDTWTAPLTRCVVVLTHAVSLS
jgi:hypothetical protein